jgi:hypothetical protein
MRALEERVVLRLLLAALWMASAAFLVVGTQKRRKLMWLMVLASFLFAYETLLASALILSCAAGDCP